MPTVETTIETERDRAMSESTEVRGGFVTDPSLEADLPHGGCCGGAATAEQSTCCGEPVTVVVITEKPATGICCGEPTTAGKPASSEATTAGQCCG